MKSILKATKDSVLYGLGRLVGRQFVTLPGEASRDDAILSVDADYRVDKTWLTINIIDDVAGQLTVELLGYDGHFSTRKLSHWEIEYDRPTKLAFNVETGALKFDNMLLSGTAVPDRRFCFRLTLRAGGSVMQRLTAHYLSRTSDSVDANYFQGENYVDYDQQSSGEHKTIISQMQQHGMRGPVLEVGCATGGLLVALDELNQAAVGIDISEWAVKQVEQRIGLNRAWQCNIERDELPPAVAEQGPFETLVLWYVFEHFHNPFAVLEKLTQHTTPDATLILGTTNSDSLTHRLFGQQWEGHFDWTHHGVDKVGVRSLREQLPRLGWQIKEVTTERIWDTNLDPAHATLRDWWQSDARFRKMLVERDLGDFITCVAARRSAAQDGSPSYEDKAA